MKVNTMCQCLVSGMVILDHMQQELSEEDLTEVLLPDVSESGAVSAANTPVRKGQ